MDTLHRVHGKVAIARGEVHTFWGWVICTALTVITEVIFPYTCMEVYLTPWGWVILPNCMLGNHSPVTKVKSHTKHLSLEDENFFPPVVCNILICVRRRHTTKADVHPLVVWRIGTEKMKNT
jgi:hypothetical protein